MTVRALVLGILVVIGFTVAGCFSVLLRYEIIGTGYLPRGVVAVVLLMVLLNGLAGAFVRRLKLSRQEILLIFIMLLAMAIIPGQDFAQHFYLNVLGIVYYTTPDIAGPELYLNDLNPALVPNVDREAPEIRWAFEGAPPGKPLPYGAWLKPLAVWTPYFLALYWMTLCFAAMMSPRWEDEEKLLFPLMQVPNELIDFSPKSPLPALLRNKMMWVCFGISCLLYVIKGLHTYFPGVPDINLQQTTKQIVAGGPGVVFNNVALHLYPEMIAIAYLLTSEVGFSMWFFYVLRLMEGFARNAMGFQTNAYPFFEYQTAGAYLVLGLALLWSARRHLAAVFRYAFGVGEAPPSSDPRPQPYRTAVFGFLIGFAFIIIWATQVGLSLTWALVMFGLVPLVNLVVSRVICEAGMFLYSSPFRLNEIIFRVGGTQRIGNKNLTLMSMMSWAQIRNTGSQFMPYAFQGLKLASQGELNRRQTVWVMFTAVVVAILVSHVVCPYVIYTWGVPKLGWWERGSSLGTTNTLLSFIRNKTTVMPADWAAMGVGGLLTMFLVAMRQRFVWWPFHPAGYAAWLGWPIDRYWLSFLLGWLIKSTVLRFFGYKAFAALRPAAFGFILGICFVLTFWLVFHFFVEGPPLVIE